MQQPLTEKWIIDTDPGIDDMMACLYMMNRKNVEILMVGTIEGNSPLEMSTTNMKKIMKMGGQNIPIHRGSSFTIIHHYDKSDNFHKADGLGDIDEIKQYLAHEIPVEKENSSLKMVEYILKYPNQVNLLLLGPLTNIAIAYMLEPSIANLVKNIYIMGGSIYSRGNMNCVGEFNFAYDAISAKIVFDNFKNVILTPWEPTEFICFHDQNLESLSHNLISQNKILHEHVHLFSKLIIEKYTKEFGGIQFCDLFSAMSVYNQNCVKKFSLCKIDVLIDSKSLQGMVCIKQKKNSVLDFDSFLKSSESVQLLQEYVLTIEEFHSEKMILDYEKVIVNKRE